MKSRARIIISALAAVALVASIAALYVHYRMLQDPTYSSFCDVNATVSCEAVLESSYAWLFGVPVAAGGAIWSGLVLLLAWRGMGSPQAERTADVAGYIFLLSTLGLAIVLYLGYASFFVIEKACPICMTMYAAVIGTFIVSGAAASGSLTALPGRAMRDLRGIVMSPAAATLAIVWLAASVSLVAFFPKPQAAAAPQATAAAPPITETLTDDQRAQFNTWIAAQPRVSLPVPADGAQVLVVKFNDYQCPACRQAYLEYRGIEQKYESQSGGKVKFVTLDFPLEGECNIGSIHASACEAAAAVRLARAKGLGPQMEEYFFSHQEGMTPDAVKAGLREVAQVTDFDAQYPKVLEEIKAEAKIGRDLGVSGTPTFFVNGIKVPSLRAVYFDALIASELARSESAKTD
jgi:uncharacterized membrane protein